MPLTVSELEPIALGVESMDAPVFSAPVPLLAAVVNCLEPALPVPRTLSRRSAPGCVLLRSAEIKEPRGRVRNCQRTGASRAGGTGGHQCEE